MSNIFNLHTVLHMHYQFYCVYYWNNAVTATTRHAFFVTVTFYDQHWSKIRFLIEHQRNQSIKAIFINVNCVTNPTSISVINYCLSKNVKNV